VAGTAVSVVAGWLTKNLQELEMNKWIIIYASITGGLFSYLFGIINGWFGFPSLLKYGIFGIFHLNNLAWVIGNWQSIPTSTRSSGKVSLGLTS
jgi:hypothetical protein